MTFSIVAFDPANGDLGVTVQSSSPMSAFPSPFAKAGVGAVATSPIATPVSAHAGSRCWKTGFTRTGVGNSDRWRSSARLSAGGDHRRQRGVRPVHRRALFRLGR